jgi:hypothetical protein
MAKTPIKDFYGKVLGYIEDLPNGDQQLRDFYMKVLGKYDKAQDVTRDFYGRVVARGNQLSMLLMMPNIKDRK